MAPMKTKRGFSLGEILIVIVIVSVLASLALPKFAITVEHNRAREGAGILYVLLNAQKHFFVENGVYAVNINLLDVDIPAAHYFDPPTVSANTNDLARIIRSPGGPFNYTLWINVDGTIFCFGAVCANLGY